MMQLKKLSILFFLFILGGALEATAQFGQPSSREQSDFSNQKKVYVGGGLDFGISSYSTILGIAPIVGYRLSPSFDVGLRAVYSYYRYNDSYIKYSTSNYGAGFFARYYLYFFSDLYLHAEYEALNYEQVYLNTALLEVDHKERIWSSSFFVGGGYRQWIGQHAFVGITVLWNLLDDINSPYTNPIFRIGVGVGL